MRSADRRAGPGLPRADLDRQHRHYRTGSARCSLASASRPKRLPCFLTVPSQVLSINWYSPVALELRALGIGVQMADSTSACASRKPKSTLVCWAARAIAASTGVPRARCSHFTHGPARARGVMTAGCASNPVRIGATGNVMEGGEGAHRKLRLIAQRRRGRRFQAEELQATCQNRLWCVKYEYLCPRRGHRPCAASGAGRPAPRSARRHWRPASCVTRRLTSLSCRAVSANAAGLAGVSPPKRAPPPRAGRKPPTGRTAPPFRGPSRSARRHPAAASACRSASSHRQFICRRLGGHRSGRCSFEIGTACDHDVTPPAGSAKADLCSDHGID